MASPFSVFRKKQRLSMVILVCLAMFSFVVVGSLSKIMDSQGRSSDQTIAECSFGEVTRTKVDQRRRARRMLNQFVAGVARRVVPGDPRWRGIPQLYDRSRAENIERYVRSQRFSTTVDDVVYGFLLDEKAKELDVVISNGAVNAYIASLTGGKLSKAQITEIIVQLRVEDNKGISERVLFAAIRNELMGRAAMEYYGQSRTVPIRATPAQQWWNYRLRNMKVQVQVLDLEVEEFIKDVKDPTDAELEKFYEDYKKNAKRRYLNVVGFTEPQRRKFEYLRLDNTPIRANIESKITDKDIKTEYDDENEKGDLSSYFIGDVHLPRIEQMHRDFRELGDPLDDDGLSDGNDSKNDTSPRAPEPPDTEPDTKKDGANKDDEKKADKEKADDKKAPTTDADGSKAGDTAESQKDDAKKDGASLKQSGVPATLAAFLQNDDVPVKKAIDEKTDNKTTDNKIPGDKIPDNKAPAEKVAPEGDPVDDSFPRAPAPVEIPAPAPPAPEVQDFERFRPLEEVRDEVIKSIIEGKLVYERKELIKRAMKVLSDAAKSNELLEKRETPELLRQVRDQIGMKRTLSDEKNKEAFVGLVYGETKFLAVYEVEDDPILGNSQAAINPMEEEPSFEIFEGVAFRGSQPFEPGQGHVMQEDLTPGEEPQPESQFLYWSIGEQPKHTPELKEIRDDVVRMWKIADGGGMSARDLAEKKAQDLVEKLGSTKVNLRDRFGSDYKIFTTELFSSADSAKIKIADSEETLRFVGEDFVNTATELTERLSVSNTMDMAKKHAYVVQLVTPAGILSDERNNAYKDFVDLGYGNRQAGGYSYISRESFVARHDALVEMLETEFELDWKIDAEERREQP